ncbi:MAG: 2-C-methyl-D-erythritol 4-phosphate cytidylyltransferase [Verrucomicrobiae bacterium]|nr:2-C-methyl-D-erythritol 4-phosphate cytidylyltransferase [Verrucomicrobiae bacterium]
MVVALIVGAGQGTRMGPGVEKLFIELAGKPVIAHTWTRFDSASCIDGIVLVVREDQLDRVAALASRLSLSKPYWIVAGGPHRQDSVWNGLQALPNSAEIVAIQDAARPCTPAELIAATVQAARQFNAAVAAQPITDTVKESPDGEWVKRTLDRAQLWTVQTPQTFRVEIIKRAVSEARRRGLQLSDDTAACELINQPVKLVIDARPNPKLTRPEDLPYIEFLLKREAADQFRANTTVKVTC